MKTKKSIKQISTEATTVATSLATSLATTASDSENDSTALFTTVWVQRRPKLFLDT